MSWRAYGFDLLIDTIERVQLPKAIIIRNTRLGIFLRILQAAAVVMVMWMVFSSKRYLYQVLPKGYIAFWIGGVGNDFQQGFNNAFCDKTVAHKYDYDYGGDWQYTDYNCTQLDAEDAYWKEGPDTMYIPLSYTENTWQRHDLVDGLCSDVVAECGTSWTQVRLHGKDMCECRTKNHFFVVGQESYTIGFEHFYERDRMYAEQYYAEETDAKGRQHSMVSCKKEGWNCEDPKGDNSELMTVVVVDTPGGVSKPILISVAPSSISIPLKEILDQSGVNLETTLNKDTQRNLFKCGSPGAPQRRCEGDGDNDCCREDVKEFPLVRQSGLEVYMDMEYMNKEYIALSIKHIPADWSDMQKMEKHGGPMCLIRIKANPVWIGRPKTDCERTPNTASGFQGSCTQRYYYNLQVVFQAGGRFGYFDPVQLAITVGAGLVYLSVPLAVISVLSMYLLGPLSKVYYAADKQNMRIADEVVGLVSRMVTASYAFRHVANEDQIITPERLLLEIQRGFGEKDSEHKLTEIEQVRLAELVFERLDKDGSGQIGLQEFVAAFTAGDSVGLEECVHFFDEKSVYNPLAKIFKPRTLITGRKQIFPRKEDGELDMARIESTMVTTRSQAGTPATPNETPSNTENCGPAVETRTALTLL